MKKIISILLILVFVLALVGCGNKTDDKNYERIVELESQLAKIVENVAKLEDTVIDLKDQLNTRAETEEVTTEKTENPTETETVTETETTEENKFDGTVLETSEYTITITDYKIIQPGEMGNEHGDVPIIAFWYDTYLPEIDNLRIPKIESLNPYSAWMNVFKAIQDNDPNMFNELYFSYLPDETYIKNKYAEIKRGGTVPCSIGYELTDTETPVTLVATNWFRDKEYGRHDYPVK
ncbi:MAG: DUF5067 domain-containing protein [Clostridiaceae bacterium]|nr:DUF5067 domain-containing protein [Clostridiaceae bacterium]